MFGIFTPRYVTEGRETLRAARRILNYKRDLLDAQTNASIQEQMRTLEEALPKRDKAKIESASGTLSALFEERFPQPHDAGWRENCEVFLVAIVIAVGVRSYFLQPFTIPTGSMQPTLNGIIPTASDQLPPGPLARLRDFALRGRTWLNVVSQEDDAIVSISDATRFGFLHAVVIDCEKQRFVVHTPATAAALIETFHLAPLEVLQQKEPGEKYLLDSPRAIHKGEPLVRGWAETGDHVFVDKVSYNFRAPRRGEVFVFSTAGIPTDPAHSYPGAPSQYYIKRLAGVPGDVLRIADPELFINGRLASEPGFKRVMAGGDGYLGYSNPSSLYGARYLTTTEDTFPVPSESYFALGDNSHRSLDSRFWGTVPRDNLMGCGLFVYWPFNSHWGWIK